MSAIGYVVIEYNQASHWPALEHETLYDTVDEAALAAKHAEEATQRVGRRETYAVARVELIEE
jgi:hypothetical protein